MSLKKNVIANFIGQGIRAAMGLVFIPLYVKYIGVESYGLIGLFGVIQAGLGLLDLGMRPALGREMARFSAGAHTAQSIRTLLRSVELVGAGIAVFVTLAVWAASSWLSTDWVTASTLPPRQVANAFAIMGAVSALRFVENIYVSSIVGLQRQVLENAMTATLATLRSVGAVAVLAFVSPTIEAFFLWQGAVSVLTVTVFAGAVYSLLPPTTERVGFSFKALREVSKFASGMLGIAILSLIFMQMDKVVLSRLLSLEAFGYYALAGVVANTLGMLTGPISTAFSPRLTELVARDDQAALRATYHQGAQAVTVFMGSAAVVWAVFAERVLTLWMNNPKLVGEVSPLVVVLAVGSAGTYLLWIPYGLQLAHGWTSLTLKVGSAFAALLVPAMLIVVPRFGAIGAAWLWVTLNHSQLVITVFLMHKRLMKDDLRQWAVEDVLAPLVMATLVAFLLRWAVPVSSHRIVELVLLVGISAMVLICSAVVAPFTRSLVVSRLPEPLRSRLLQSAPSRP